jgi:3-methyladenine DNA glycosylase AlkC
MATALKNQFGAEVVQRIAAMLAAVAPQFDAAAFSADALQGYEALELLARARQITRALRRHLPADAAQAIELLLASLGPKLARSDAPGMAPFLYLPHVYFVAEHGLDHFELAMRAQHELTQRFTAEFSIRAFLERHPQATLARLRQWAVDPSEHVRRLVSEGTRPRLPWAPRLRAFQRDPQPVLALLELLKDDPSPYVRRSVANNLNDIGKDHPALLVEVAQRWLQDAPPPRRQLLRHALRSAIKRADPAALALFGAADAAEVGVEAVSLTPRQPQIGAALQVALTLRNPTSQPQRVLADLRLHYARPGGRTAPKVFKLRLLDLAPGQAVALAKRITLADLTTRRHYPGVHQVELLLNGRALPLGGFELLPARPDRA